MQASACFGGAAGAVMHAWAPSTSAQLCAQFPGGASTGEEQQPAVQGKETA